MPLPVLYEDDACLVIEKPAGIAVHPGTAMKEGEKTLLDDLRLLFKERSLPFFPEEVLVHRLDKGTTGCLLIAKTPEYHARFQEQFKDRAVKKTYLAIVHGVPKHPEATIDAPIGRSFSNTVKMGVIGVRKGREAQTTYRVIQQGQTCALLECDLHTGRTHQVRVHLSSIGHPVLGDEKYGTNASKKFSQQNHITHLCLHAWKLGFTSLADVAWHGVGATVPGRFQKTLQSLGLESVSS